MTEDRAERDAFAQKCLAELKRIAPNSSYQYQPEKFQLGDESGRTIYLGNIFDEYRKAGLLQRRGFIERRMRDYLQMLSAPALTRQEALSQLMPKIRERIAIERIHAEQKIEGKEPYAFAYKVIGQHLTLEVAIDMPTSVMTVGRRHLEEWGITFDEALSYANTNALKSGVGKFEKVGQGLYISSWGDNYDSSRMHLSAVISSVPVAGRPVAMVPRRECLLITGADDVEGLVKMAKVAEEELAKRNPMTGFAFRLDDGWVPFLPKEGHPAFAHLRQLATWSLCGYYGAQTDWLTRLFEMRGQDIFVQNPIIGTDKETGACQSFATWTEGVAALLPETDSIAFLRPGPAGKPLVLGSLAWKEAYEQLRALMEPQEGYPPRYLVRSFPSKERLATLNLKPFP